MSRELLNNKYCIRCGRKGPTPYLKKYIHLFKEDTGGKVVDIGCGNGRNSDYMKSQNFKDVNSIDMKPDYGVATVLGKDALPIPDKSADIILANYIFMFLNKRELDQVLEEIKRIAKPGAYLMVELYAAKDSECPTMPELVKYRDYIAATLKWNKIRFAKERCILQKAC